MDEFWMPMKMKFKEYDFTSITKGEVDLEDSKDEKKESEQPKENKDFISYLKDHLKDKVKE